MFPISKGWGSCSPYPKDGVLVILRPRALLTHTSLLPPPSLPHSDGDDDDDDAMRECLERFAGFSTLRGGPPGVSHGLRSRQNCGDVSSGLPVWVLNILRFRSRFRGCLERGAGFGGPPGGSHGLRSRSDCEDVSSGLLVFGFNILRFRNRFRGCLVRGVGFRIPGGPDCEDVSSGLLVLVANIFRFRTRS